MSKHPLFFVTGVAVFALFFSEAESLCEVSASRDANSGESFQKRAGVLIKIPQQCEQRLGEILSKVFFSERLLEAIPVALKEVDQAMDALDPQYKNQIEELDRDIARKTIQILEGGGGSVAPEYRGVHQQLLDMRTLLGRAGPAASAASLRAQNLRALLRDCARILPLFSRISGNEDAVVFARSFLRSRSAEWGGIRALPEENPKPPPRQKSLGDPVEPAPAPAPASGPEPQTSFTDGEGRRYMPIAAGGFQMGSREKPGAPERRVEVSAFFVAQTEVTYGQWSRVLGWAKQRGYQFTHDGTGVSDMHPVTGVNWFDVVKWCNAKSEREGLKPCYYFTKSRQPSEVYRSGEGFLTRDMVDWSANGYRLPTEAEWEKAARGGLVGKRYPNGDSFTQKDGNHGESGAVVVGSYAPNGYGLHDMAGNVWEWCWDWKSGSAGRDQWRVIRGGCWGSGPEGCRVSHRSSGAPSLRFDYVGFRPVRSRGGK